MSDRPRIVRSYQRIFRPDRRIYQVDGRTLPVPGGIPLRWLAYAVVTLLAGIALASGTRALIVGAAVAVAALAVRLGRRRLAPVAAAITVLVCLLVGELLRTLDWPLRLIVVPALVATVMTQLTPDGRPALRYALSWLRTQFAGRRSAGRSVMPAGRPRPCEIRVRVAHDRHDAVLRRACITGPAHVRFHRPVSVERRRRHRVARALSRRTRRPRGVVLDEVRVDDGERLRVRP